ncbi:MAG: DsrE family protein [Verrucomicrobiae bacterium]|nr:DsrE family protein [Verrucomicrobiae bacterium]
MKLGLVIYSTDAEVIWNAFRLGVFALKQGDSARVFLLAKGVESESLDSEKFPIRDQMRAFVEAGGRILACGTCLQLRQSDGTEFCPLSTMQDLYELVRDSDQVVSF